MIRMNQRCQSSRSYRGGICHVVPAHLVVFSSSSSSLSYFSKDYRFCVVGSGAKVPAAHYFYCSTNRKEQV